MAQSEQAAKSQGHKSDQHPPAAHQESTSAKLHRWFDIRQMTVAGRYTFLGIVIVFTVLLFFFIGLAIDFALRQPAAMALWGIGLGSLVSLIFTYRQLMKLVDRSSNKRTTKLSKDEQALLEQAQLDVNLSKAPAASASTTGATDAATPSSTDTKSSSRVKSVSMPHRHVGRTANRPANRHSSRGNNDSSTTKATQINHSPTPSAISADELAKLSPEEQRILAEASTTNADKNRRS